MYHNLCTYIYTYNFRHICIYLYIQVGMCKCIFFMMLNHKNLLAMYRKAGALSVRVAFRKVKTHLYSVPLAVPLKFTAVTFTIKFFISKTWPKGLSSWKNNSPPILHDGCVPRVRLQLNTAISSGGINITSDGPWAIIWPLRQ